MLDRLATLAHGLRIGVKALLHGFEQMLVLPPRDPPLRPCRALGFERTIRTCRCPVAPQRLAVFLVRIAIRQSLACGAAILIRVGQIDEVLLAEAALRLGP